jgi:hypothetical protein
MAGGATTRRVRFATAMLVDVEESVRASCATLLAELGYHVEVVAHPLVASGSIPVLCPLLVIASASSLVLLQDHAIDLDELATAVGGQLVVVPSDATESVVTALLRDAARARA